MAQFKSTDGHATQNVLIRWHNLVEDTTNPSHHSSPSPFFSPILNLTSNETTRPSSIFLTTSTGTSIERPMIKFGDVAITMKKNCQYHHQTRSRCEGEVLSRPKVDASIEKNALKIANLWVIRDYEVITNVEFKIRVKDLLDFQSIVTIPTMFYCVIMVFVDNFKICEILVTLL